MVAVLRPGAVPHVPWLPRPRLSSPTSPLNPPQIVSGSRDKTIKLWNTLGECKYTLGEPDGHTEWVSCVRFSPVTQNPIVVSAGWDKAVKVRWGRDGAGPAWLQPLPCKHPSGLLPVAALLRVDAATQPSRGSWRHDHLSLLPGVEPD